MATFEFVGGSTRTGDSTFTRRLDNGSRRRVTGTFAPKPGAGSGRRSAGDGGQEKLDVEGPSSFQSYRPTFSERLISTFGLEELGLSTRATERFTDEEYDLIDGVLNEDAPTEDMEFSRRYLDAMDQKVAGVGSSPEDDYLGRLGRLIHKYNVPLPKIQVEFRDVTITTQALVGSAAVPTVGSSFINLAKSLLFIKPKTKSLVILNNVKGVIQPGRLTLLLGPPGCGKSSLLKVMAGRIRDGGPLAVTGDVKYNGHNLNEFEVVRTSAYVGQLDNHIAALSVYDTLEFAHTCQVGYKSENYNLISNIQDAVIKAGYNEYQSQRLTSGRHGEEPGGPEEPGFGSVRKTEEANTAGGKIGMYSQRTTDAIAAAAKFGEDEEEFMKLLAEIKHTRGLTIMSVMRSLGISHTKDTPVGDAMLRGVSGGERKRVTLAEMLVGGRGALFLDEISTGLDSATLYNIVNTLGRLTRTMGLCCVVSLLQPPPEVYFLYDDLILMSQGSIVWHGPVGEVVPFFNALGFHCPTRKDVPSFLQEVTTESGQLEYATDALLADRGFEGRAFPEGRKRYVIPTDEVVANFYQSSKAGQKMTRLLDRPFSKAKSHPAALKQGKYALSAWESLKVVTTRQALLTIKDAGLIRGRLVQTIVIGLIVGGLFWQQSAGAVDSNGAIISARGFFGASFLLVMFASMSGMPQLVVGMLTKGVWFKHRDNLFYPAWVHSVAMTVVAIPPQLLDTFVWCMITYFMIGFFYGAGYWFTFFLILFCVAYSFGAMFRSLAHLAPDGIAANNLGALLLLVVVVMSGFTIIRTNVPDWWIWAYWLSPYSWGMRSLVVNEFTSPPWRYPYNFNASYLTPGQSYTVGEAALMSFAFYTGREWVWAGVGYLFGFVMLCAGISSLALQYLSGPQKVAALPDEKELEKARQAALERKRKLGGGDAEMSTNAMKDSGDAPGVPSVLVTNDVKVTVGGASSSIPFTQITVVWRDLRYIVPNPGYVKGGDKPEKLTLLDGITGFAEPGTLTALMGGSGAGKTTLMDCIAGRKTVGEITGDITVNGHPKDQGTWARVMGYVEQMDIHTPAQTIIEALLFSARLRLPSETTDDQVRGYVDEVVDLVDLTEIMFNLVGVPGQTGLSVEQRKRLTIANEMVANPSVIFMDEPTSGLDARAASIVMRAVRNVGNSNRAVLVTIHQPSIEIFEAFDNLLLLKRGGKIIFFGGLGKESINLINFLQGGSPDVARIKDGANPATWMLEVTGGATSTSGAKAANVDWINYYANSELSAENAAKADRLIEEDSRSKLPLTVSGGKYAAPFGMQFWELMKKYNRAYWRTPSYNYMRYIITAVVAVLYGSIYYKAADIQEGQLMPAQNVQSIGGVIYLSVSFLGMANMMAVMPLVALERTVYYREQAASYYNPWAYGIAISLIEIPYQLVQVLLFVCIMYPMLFFVRTADHFFFYVLLSFLTLMFFVAFGMALVYITPSQQLAQVMGSGLNFLFNIFNGYVIAFPAMAPGFQWVNRISPTTWVIYGLVADQLSWRDNKVTGLPGNQDITVSEFMQMTYGYKYSFRFWTILILIAYVAFFRVLGVLALRYVSFLRR